MPAGPSALRRGGAFLAAALAASAAARAQDDAPAMPPAGAVPLLETVADGVQVYACEPRGNGAPAAWVFRAPEAALFDAAGRQVGTHGAGPRWRLADGSNTAGAVAASAPAPRPGAIPWLLLRATPGPEPGRLRDAAWIRRFDTEGGAAPASGCEPGETARMRYSARYAFFAAAPPGAP